MEILTVCLYSLTLLSLCYASVLSPDFETKLQTIIDASMKCRHIPGMTLSVVKGMTFTISLASFFMSYETVPQP